MTLGVIAAREIMWRLIAAKIKGPLIHSHSKEVAKESPKCIKRKYIRALRMRVITSNGRKII
jgi:hypothetical protein